MRGDGGYVNTAPSGEGGSRRHETEEEGGSGGGQRERGLMRLREKLML
jgi:hypothetical protein